jgi:hypothetical protein
MHRDATCSDETVRVSPVAGVRLTSADDVVSAIEEYATLDSGPFYADNAEVDCALSNFAEHYTGGPVPLEAFAAVALSVE